MRLVTRIRPIAIVFAMAGTTACGSPESETRSMETHRQALIDCSATISRLNYEGPGTDTAEFIQLRVTGAENSDGGLTLGECGAASIELVNGGNNECPVYRTIDIADVLIPASGRVLICSGDSELNERYGCDYDALPNNWIQNGPADGVVLYDEAQSVQTLGYPGAELCFDEFFPVIKEPTAADGDWANVLCEHGAQLKPLIDIDLESDPVCPLEDTIDWPDSGSPRGDAGTAPPDRIDPDPCAGGSCEVSDEPSVAMTPEDGGAPNVEYDDVHAGSTDESPAPSEPTDTSGSEAADASSQDGGDNVAASSGSESSGCMVASVAPRSSPVSLGFSALFALALMRRRRQCG